MERYRQNIINFIKYTLSSKYLHLLLLLIEYYSNVNKNKLNDINKTLSSMRFIFIQSIAIFIIIVIIFDVLIFHYYNRYLFIAEHSMSNVIIEHNVYEILVLTGVSSLMCLRQRDLAMFFNSTTNMDNYLNTKVEAEYQVMYSVKQIQRSHGSLFDSYNDVLQYNCDNIFEGINDSLTYDVSKERNVEYIALQKSLYKNFEIFHLYDVDFIQTKLLYLAQTKINSLVHYTYEELYEFNSNKELYDAYTITLMLFRPIMTYVREHSIIPLMDTAIDFYLLIVWIYFTFNITACIILFFIIKVWIIKKLNDHYDNLYLLSMCFYVVHD